VEEEEDVFGRMKSGHTVVKPEVHAFTSHSHAHILDDE
jgi:hypothetical protein